MMEHNKSDRCCYRAVFRIIKGKNMKNTIPIHVGPKFQGLIPARIQARLFETGPIDSVRGSRNPGRQFQMKYYRL